MTDMWVLICPGCGKTVQTARSYDFDSFPEQRVPLHTSNREGERYCLASNWTVYPRPDGTPNLATLRMHMRRSRPIKHLAVSERYL